MHCIWTQNWSVFWECLKFIGRYSNFKTDSICISPKIIEQNIWFNELKNWGLKLYIEEDYKNSFLEKTNKYGNKRYYKKFSRFSI